MKAVSELVAVLIVLAIVVGVAVGVSLIITGIVQNQSPRSSDLVVSGGKAYLDASTLVIKATITVFGSDPVTVTRVEVFKGTTSIAGSVSVYIQSTMLSPGSSTEIVVYVRGVSGLTLMSGDILTLVVYWQDMTTGQTSVSRGEVIVS